VAHTVGSQEFFAIERVVLAQQVIPRRRAVEEFEPLATLNEELRNKANSGGRIVKQRITKQSQFSWKPNKMKPLAHLRKRRRTNSRRKPAPATHPAASSSNGVVVAIPPTINRFFG
jgi:hypothetical protein